jgi:hypothetical protein
MPRIIVGCGRLSHRVKRLKFQTAPCNNPPPAARAVMDRISHGVGFDTTPIATALNWGRCRSRSPQDQRSCRRR